MANLSKPDPADLLSNIVITVGLSTLVIGVFHWAIKNDEKKVVVEEKYIINRCKPLSHSAVASPTVSSRPLSIYLCKDGDIQTYFVTNTKAK